VLAAFWLALVASLRNKSLTSDEIVHATAGYTYWRFDDYRINPENGNLPQRIIGIPIAAGDYKFPLIDSELWWTSQEWALSDRWFHRVGNRAEDILLRGRAAAALTAVALGVLVWVTSRRLFGPAGGMLSLAVFALDPTVLANGALMTSDTAAALFFLASALALWTAFGRVSARSALLSSLAVAALAVSKMSALLIVPIALVLAAARLLSRRPIRLELGKPRDLIGRSDRARALALVAAVHVAVVWLAVWAFYGFRYSAFAESQPGRDRLPQTWEFVLDKPAPPALIDRLNLGREQRARAASILQERDGAAGSWRPGSAQALEAIETQVLSPEEAHRLEAMIAAPPPAWTARALDFMRRYRLLPEAYLYGHAYVWKMSQERSAFMNGKFSLHGWRSFFPYTFLVKTPLPFFGMLALAAVAAWRTAGALRDTVPLWTLVTVYGAAAIASHLDIGHRHILVVYPPLFILCGAAARWLPRPPLKSARPAGWALCGLLAALAAETAYRFPNYLAYFNPLAGGPAQGYRHLVDSSFDWGQDLPGVKRWIEERRPDGPTYLSYFGSASPDYYKVPATLIYSEPGWDRASAPALQELDLPVDRADSMLAQILAAQPQYEVVERIASGPKLSVTLVKRPSALRLTGGTYFISASMLQPIHNARNGPWGPWNARHERVYQELYRTVRPLLEEDRQARARVFGEMRAPEWRRLFDRFDAYRFARLTAYLRSREPNDNVDFSILVYKLDDADLGRALDGPPPELGPDLE